MPHGTRIARQYNVAKLPDVLGKADELRTDYLMHHRIEDAMQKFDSSHEIGARLPKLGERVLPAPLPVGEALVDALLPTTIRRRKQDFLTRPENKNCLIRTYLGRRHTTKAQNRIQNLKLQNFPLHVNEMEQLGLDTAHFASLMANNLAIVHCGAMVNGNDVEFILGSSPAQIRRVPPEEAEVMTSRQMCDAIKFEFNHRAMAMWLIDFNQTIKAASTSLPRLSIFNASYYPRQNQPDDLDKELWGIFRKAYLDMSHRVTESSGPDTFIARVEMERKEESIDNLF
ncbi:hypothetical protein CGRA01v4_07287 [Colletotrichum graminicola]|uniref:DUF3669 domain-containing protein n=1 Tax=Colletotrichum graminicola (strain M1.001 / M2 / FGSC 10212) TaxID=645133 RepID=E3QCD4_COLGM|nr:uncharacterized protein GLRG_03666 [Colletotrichum graminicola M1.001]EFQ28522.1 hypothetical protein GLRG_03666 [Colletotrichum graminicola M1.001]WDK16006.1 hypothetical protein CGRA01v4_07287 [Colletotrichum graminicola]